MKTMIRACVVLSLLVFVVVGQAQMVNNFDSAPADTNYWEWYDPINEGAEDGTADHFAVSANADPALGWIDRTYNTENMIEGDGSMQIDYSVHNIEGWGGYSKIHHYFPDTLSSGLYDWSLYDSISFAYNNLVAQSDPGTVTLRLNVMDYGDITDPAYHDLGEWYYSFHAVLDNEPGWTTAKLALERGDGWGGDNFTYTGWAGEAGGNLEFDADAVKGF
ncbi:hypothetical protein HQ531_15655, partial [bacterium]|nr:hypothetical protein [bacterium]